MADRNKKFPQADSIDKILYIIEKFDEDDIKEKEYLAENINIDPRQVDYYLDALYYLDIIDENLNYTEVSEVIKSANLEQKKLHLRNLIINRPVFKQVYKILISKDSLPDKEDIARLIQQYFGLNDTTANRRASTVVKWMKWMERNDILYTAHNYKS